MVEFKSTEDGAIISFSIARKWESEIEFYVEVKNTFGSVKAVGSTYYNGSPAILFQAMATEWKGWKKEKTWKDLEDRVIFTASSDLTGHAKLFVELTDYQSSFKTCLLFDAGQLEGMAKEISILLPADPT